MAGGRKLNNINDFQRSLRNKYGLEEGTSYKPWIRVQDIPSQGTSSKIWGLKTQREHHLLSHNESVFFYLCEHSDRVIDIREQFPLLPLDHTLRIASSLNIKHPLVVSTKNPNVMTTDFLLTCQRDGQLSYEAICVKPAEELANKRTAEKIDIERVFWELLGVRFRIFVLTKQLKAQAANIKWATWPLRHGNYEDEFLDEAVLLIGTGLQMRTTLCERIVRHLGVELDDAINVMRALIGSKRVQLDSSRDWLEAEAFNILAIQTLGVRNQYRAD